jgi:hypothetical protein
MATIASIIGYYQKRYSLDISFDNAIASLIYQGKHLFEPKDISDYMTKHRINPGHLWKLDSYIDDLVRQKKLIVFTISPTTKKYMATPKFRSQHMI